MTKYERLMDAITPELICNGFTRIQTEFHCSQKGYHGIISMQRNSNSYTNNYKFTLVIGVVCSALKTFFNDVVQFRSYRIHDAHWREELGPFILGNQRHCWVLNDDNISIVADQVLEVLRKVGLPLLNKYMVEDHLLRAWKVKNGSEIMEFRNMVNLTSLLRFRANPQWQVIANDYKKKLQSHHLYNEWQKHVRWLNSFQ
ncbi:DUF4304 domain-containing protein [Chitinophaga pinensis]|nr:DUF4304 domain-containing protein [Chitinophaga pinensis]